MRCKDVNEASSATYVMARSPAVFRQRSSSEKDDNLCNVGKLRAANVERMTAFVRDADLLMLFEESQGVPYLTSRLSKDFLLEP